jgi:hypothetical protein
MDEGPDRGWQARARRSTRRARAVAALGAAFATCALGALLPATVVAENCPAFKVLPHDCRYDIAVAVSARPARVDGTTPPQRIEVTVTIANHGPISSPVLAARYPQGLRFVAVPEVLYGKRKRVELPNMPVVPEQPRVCRVDRNAVFCSLTFLDPGHSEANSFTVRYTAAVRREIARARREHKDATGAVIELQALVHRRLVGTSPCFQSETNCRNNRASAFVGVV